MKYKLTVRFENKDNLSQFCDLIGRPDLKVSQSNIKKINYKHIRDFILGNNTLIDNFGEDNE